MQVGSDPGFRWFHQNGVNSGSCEPCRNLRGTKHRKSRGCKTRKEAGEDKETTDLSAMVK